MRDSMRTRWVYPVLLATGMTTTQASVRADDRPAEPPPRESQSAQAESEPVNPTRRLESEIEEFPAPPDTATDDDATAIPEMVEPRPLPPSELSRAGAPEIDPSEVQRVLGSDTAMMALDSLDVTQVTLMQQRLRERGLYLGPIDGIAGPQTRTALRALAREQFELGQRLLRQGQMTDDLAELVGITNVGTTRPSP
jgi:Putative peptidoglycan binding domain